MAWDGSGNFDRTNGVNTGVQVWQDDRDGGTKIRADRHDVHDEDLADGIQECLTKDGQSKATATQEPGTDASYDLGSAAKQWRNLYLSGDIKGDVGYTGMQRWAKGADVASANALTLGDDGNYFDITGTTAITSIGAKGIGTTVVIQFDGILTLTHHATDLILPSAANITTAAGDQAIMSEYSSGDWRCVSYTRADGTSVVSGAALTESFISADQTITASGGLTIAHGLSAAPQLLQFRLKSVSTNLGYAIGDEVIINNDIADSGSGRGLAVWPDATNLNVRYGTSFPTFTLPHKTTGVMTGIVNNQWRLILRAWS